MKIDNYRNALSVRTNLKKCISHRTCDGFKIITLKPKSHIPSCLIRLTTSRQIIYEHDSLSEPS